MKGSEFVLAIIALILTLLLVVGIHEGGHALAARYFRVKIKKISIGFGKSIISWKSSSGCEWVWAILPLGGYVQLENTRVSTVDTSQYTACFDKKPIWQRILILLAGAIANIFTAWCALILVYHLGLNYSLPIIKSTHVDSPAAQAGIASGDQIVSIAKNATPSWNDVGMQLIIFWGKKEVPVILSRNKGNELIEAKLNLSQVPFHKGKTSLLTQLGIEPDLNAPHGIFRFSTLGETIHQTNVTIAKMLYFFLMIFKQLFSGAIPFSMFLGPLGVFAASVASLTQGIVVFMFFIATLSVAVALVNLLPIPGLDGGSIVYAMLEKIRRKPVSVAMELLLHRLVLIVFCIMLFHLLMYDLQRL